MAAVKARIEAIKEERAALAKKVQELREARDFKRWGEVNAKIRAVDGELEKLLAQVDQYELKVANALWGEQTYPFKDDYFEKISRFYKTGGVFAVDFINEAEEIRGRINSWVEEKTNNRIKDLIPAGAIDDLTRLVLVNAIYFKGEWSVPFKEESTEDREFHFADGSVEKKPIMFARSLKVASYAAFNGDGTRFDTPTMIARGVLVPGGGDARRIKH